MTEFGGNAPKPEEIATSINDLDMSQLILSGKESETMAEKLDMTNINMLNAVRQTMSVDYRDRVPVATRENIADIAKTLTDPYNPMARNELVPALVNLIASQSIRVPKRSAILCVY